MAVALHPGEPFTLELYNALVAEVNGLNQRLGGISEQINGTSFLYGKSYAITDLCLDVNRSKNTWVPKDKQKTGRVSFSRAFKKPPAVVASARLDKEEKYQMLVTVGNISTSDFYYTAFLTPEDAKLVDRNVPFEIVYIAVGD